MARLEAVPFHDEAGSIYATGSSILAAQYLLLCHFAARVFEDLAQHTPAHLFRLLDAVDVKDGGREVIHRSFETHQAQVVLDPGPHGKERSRYVVAISKVML